jgi:hypothetical protein
MKTQTLSLIALALGLALAGPALAQDTVKYDLIRMSKRVDLRLQWIHAQKEDANRVRMHRTDESNTESQEVKDRPRLVDFMALSSKRADLRMRANKIGIMAAYDEWDAQQHGK